MSLKDTKELLKFLKSFPDEKREMALWLREFVWKLYPKTNELIYDNYNALAIGWSLTERLGHAVCSIAIGRGSYNIHFGFYWGSQISDPEKLLLGKGSQYRYILVKSKTEFPKTYIKKLVKDAYLNSIAKVKDKNEIKHGVTIVRCITAKKRPVAKRLRS